MVEKKAKFYAHSKEGAPPEQWQLLEDHLLGAAKLAAAMAGEFGSGGWGYLAGLWHDLGKYSAEFQKRISDPDAHIKVDHSTPGALYATEHFEMVGRILAYVIAGHHAGLPDYESDATGRAALSRRLQQTDLFSSAMKTVIPQEILDRPLPKEKPKPDADPALWIRLLFSCLTDADFLDTETFLDPAKAFLRTNNRKLPDLLELFSNYMEKKHVDALDSKVNRIRAEVLTQSIAKAAGAPAIYTMTVPTGGGKTLSSMAFALHHAVKHGKRRIIYVIPYTSIIEQTADQFRDIFGDAVIEHQSNLDVSDPAKDSAHSRLACENWGAPLIVTTSVQFFESLFASHTSRCRKLHNIVNSVVILDEAQLLPPEFLNPILHVLRELQKNYGVTFLLCTATQPALGPHKSFDFNFDGLPDMVEIVDDPLELHNKLKGRVEVKIPSDFNEARSWKDMTVELTQYPSVLCIVNRRDDCRALWQMMPQGKFHLSGLMCGAHRSEKIREIKKRLKEGIPTRVISTQLVEAGVDVDFPVVYRALAGLDSIAQAAGRCNREGLQDKGQVVVFVPPSDIPAGHLRQAAQIGRQLMSQDFEDILSPDRFEQFFREFYWLQGKGLDKHAILVDLQMRDFKCSFRSAADNFHLIDEKGQSPVVVMYGDGADLIRILEQSKPERWLLRRLQRYVVNLPRYLHSKLLAEGAIRELHPGIYVQGHLALYDEDLGFCPDKSIVYEPDELMV